MNTVVLQKCVDELKKEQPDIRYLLGILETFIELSGKSVNNLGLIQTTGVVKTYPPEMRTDEEDTELARNYATGPIGKIT